MVPVIIPTLDEADTIGSVINRFREVAKSGPECAIYVVVDPDTTDNTREVVIESNGIFIDSPHHGKGQGVEHALSVIPPFTEVVLCDGDIELTVSAARELLLPLGYHTGQRIVIPRFPTATEWDEATQFTGLKFNPDAWPMVSGLRKVRHHCIPHGLYGYLMETQINQEVARHGYLTERSYSHDTLSPLRFTPRRVADLLEHGKYGKDHGIL